jgi:dimethylargininase
MIAITRGVSAAIGRCELTYLERATIDVQRAREQHTAYERALADAGCRIERLPGGDDMPDCVFVEDIAIVFDELAVITRPGAGSRRAEAPAIADALVRYRAVRTIDAPATIDGGDVLVAGRRVFVGRSSRTNGDAVAQLRRLVAPFGYVVCDVEVRDCLHLKSAVTSIDDDTLLVNPARVNASAFGELAIVDVEPSEPEAANALRLRDRVIASASYPKTADRLAARGVRVETIDLSELAKAEGAVTCCSLIVNDA